MDRETLTFLYDLYFQPRMLAAAASTPPASANPAETSSMVGIAAPTLPGSAESAAALGPNDPGRIASDGDLGATGPATSFAQPSLVTGQADPGAATTFDALAIPPLATLSQTVFTTSVFICSDGSLQSIAIQTVTLLVYDPAASVVSTVTLDSTTVVTVLALPTATPSIPFANGTQNDTFATPTLTALSSPLAASSEKALTKTPKLVLGLLLILAGYLSLA